MTPAGMSEWGPAGAFGLGIAAALHPCPLSTLAGAVLLVLAPDRPLTGTRARIWRRPMLRAGALVLGMVVALALVATAIGGGLTETSFFTTVFSNVLRPLLPPLLIVAGILQTGVFASSSRTLAGTARERWLKAGLRSTPRMFTFGMVLGLSFCPATAGLFFGILIPLAMTHGHPALYAVTYGIGYGLPLLAVAVCLGFGTRFEVVRHYAATWSKLCGWALIALGAWLTWKLL